MRFPCVRSIKFTQAKGREHINCSNFQSVTRCTRQQTQRASTESFAFVGLFASNAAVDMSSRRSMQNRELCAPQTAALIAVQPATSASLGGLPRESIPLIPHFRSAVASTEFLFDATIITATPPWGGPASYSDPALSALVGLGTFYCSPRMTLYASSLRARCARRAESLSLLFFHTGSDKESRMHVHFLFSA